MRCQEIGKICECYQWTKDLWQAYSLGKLPLPSGYFLGPNYSVAIITPILGRFNLAKPSDWILTDSTGFMKTCDDSEFKSKYVEVK